MADAYIGEIRIFSGNYAPRGWALCNGQLLSIPQNTALFSILGTKFGGDGKTNFALPNLMGKTPLHYGHGTGLEKKDFAKEGGTVGEILLTSQIPSHTHVPNNKDSPNEDSPVNAYWSNTNTTPKNGVLAYVNLDPYTPMDPTPPKNPYTPMNPSAIQVVGGSQSHNNMQPYLALNFIICINSGEYPVKE